jgi:hypothetical protein
MKSPVLHRSLRASLVFPALVLGACVAGPPPGVVYASYAPPAAQVEVVGVSPGADYVWIPGYHAWRNNAYVWVPGRYERAPHAGARWERGAWRHHQKGWYWVDGHWR